MIFRLMIILVVYQLAFVGVSIFYFGDFEQVVSLIAFLTSLLLLGFIVDPRAKVLGLNERIRQDTTNSGLIFFIGIFLQKALIEEGTENCKFCIFLVNQF